MECVPTSLAMAIQLLLNSNYGIDDNVNPKDVIRIMGKYPWLWGYNPQMGAGPNAVDMYGLQMGLTVDHQWFQTKQDLIEAIKANKLVLVSYGEWEERDIEITVGQSKYHQTYLMIKWAHTMVLYGYKESTGEFGFLDPAQPYCKQKVIHWILEGDFLPKWHAMFGQMWIIDEGDQQP